MLAGDGPRHIVKRRRGTRCRSGRKGKGAIRFGNKQVGEGRRHEEQTNEEKTSRERRRDEGLQRRTAAEMQIQRNEEVRRANGDRKCSRESIEEQVGI